MEHDNWLLVCAGGMAAVLVLVLVLGFVPIGRDRIARSDDPVGFNIMSGTLGFVAAALAVLGLV